MRTRVTLTLSALLLCGGMSLASGCGNENTGNNGTGTADGVRPNALGLLNNAPPGGYNATPNDRNRIPNAAANENGQVARINEAMLARIAEQVPGVERADIAMNGTEVLVGIELDNADNRHIVEKRVISALQWQYPEYRYHATSDETLRMKIKSARQRKTGNYRAQMYDQDIKALARTIDQSLNTRP